MLRSRLRVGVFLVLAAVAATVAAPGPSASSAGSRTVWATDGPVDAVAAARDDTVYLGGEFTSVSTDSTRGFAAIGSTGSPDAGWPTAAGEVHAIAPDGSGGWYVGGSFTAVGGVPAPDLVHLRADRTVDRAWRAQANGEVDALAVSRNGSTLYVGGRFSRLNGRPRAGLGAILAATGKLLPWNAHLGTDVPHSHPGVLALALGRDGALYLGGFFTSVRGKPRRNLAAVSVTSATPLAWNPSPDQDVVALLTSSDGRLVYVGGEFMHIASRAQRGFAALDARSGRPVWPDARLKPSYASVEALALDNGGSTLYVGGEFVSFAGAPRSNLAALDARSGAVRHWHPTSTPEVVAIAVSSDGRTVYAGGLGFHFENLVAFDAGSGTPTVWNPRPNDWVLALAVRGDTVYAGGWFTGFGGVAHPYLAAIAPSGAISPWQGYAPGPVHALAPSGGPVLYAAMQDTSWVRALRTARTGAVWSARPTGYVHAVALDPGGSTVYADGTPGIVAIDATHGVIDPAWRPQPPPHNATSLAVTETAVFAADGSVAAFDRKDGHRHWLASVALGPRGALALALSPDGTRLYTAGAFVRIGAATRRNVAALDPRTGAVLSWKAALPGLVHALVATGSTLYAGGEFGVASIDVPTGAVKILDRPGEVLALALGPDGSALYAGGRFGLLRLSI